MFLSKLKNFTLSLFLISFISSNPNALQETHEESTRKRERSVLRLPEVTAVIIDAAPAATIERAVAMADVANHSRLTTILGRPPLQADYEYDARLSKLLVVWTPTAHDYQEIPRMTRVLGHFPTIEEYEADARLTAVLNPDTDVVTRHPTQAEINEAIRMIEDLGGEPTAAEFAACWNTKAKHSGKMPSNL